MQLRVAGARAAIATLAVACGDGGTTPASGPPARPVATPICSPVSYGGPGRPRFLIVNNNTYQGPHKGHGVQTGQAIKMVLAGAAGAPGLHRRHAGVRGNQLPNRPAQRRECKRNARAFAHESQRARRHRAVDLILRRLNAAHPQPSATRSARRHQRLQHLRRPHARRGRDHRPGEPQRYFPSRPAQLRAPGPTDDVQGAADALVAQRLGLRRAFVLDDRSPYGTALAGSFRSTASRLGVGVVGTAHVSPAAHDYRALAGRVRAAHPTVVFVAGDLGNAGPRLIAQLTAVLGPHVRLIGGDAVSPAPLVEAAGPRVDGMILSIAVLPTTSLPPNGRRFAAEFQKRYTQLPCCYSVHDAQATELLLDAIAKAGGNRARIAQYLIGARVHDGLLGDFTDRPQRRHHTEHHRDLRNPRRTAALRTSRYAPKRAAQPPLDASQSRPSLHSPLALPAEACASSRRCHALLSGADTGGCGAAFLAGRGDRSERP